MSMSRLENQDGFRITDEKPDSETVRQKNAGLREKNEYLRSKTRT
ncbi:MAG: hypothetical protein U0L31_03825 [Bifidobacteriaceae bacterium]|nr:hypothetical protein [Bifidobacteriaceae bacterium]